MFHTMTTAASNASFTRVTAHAQRNAPAFKKTHSSFTAFNGSAVLCGDCCVHAQALSPSIADIFEDFGCDAFAIAHSSFAAFNGSAVLCGDGSAVLCGDCCVHAQALSPSIANIFEDFGYDAFAIAHSSFTAFNGSAVLCGDCCESLFFCALERHDTTRRDTT